MANSPKVEVFFLYDSSGHPLTGAAPDFSIYKDTTGADVAQPSIVEIGGGAYMFTPDPALTTTAIAFIIDGTVSSVPRFVAGFLRPEDFNVDFLTDLNDEGFGTWKIQTSGPDANRLVMFRRDGSTVLKKFDLKDSAGSPTFTNPFQRIPV
jgi:hypothetical protein